MGQKKGEKPFDVVACCLRLWREPSHDEKPPSLCVMAEVGKPKVPLWRLFVGTVYGATHGKVLLGIWGSYVLYLLALRKKRLSSDRGAGKGSSSDGGDGSGGDKSRTRPSGGGPLSHLVSLLKPYALRRQGAIFALYVFSLCTRILVTVQLSDTSGRLAAMMGARKFEAMFRKQAWFSLFCFAAAGSTAVMKFLEKQVALEVRGILFARLKERYLGTDGSRRFFEQDLDDASARLTADLDDFSAELVHLTGHFLKPLIDILYLSAVVGRRIGLFNLGVFYSFFFFSDWSLKRLRARALPHSLKELAVDRNAREARLRGTLAGIHHYREQIAMQGGAAHERAAVDAQYQTIHDTAVRESTMYSVMDAVSGYTLKFGGLMCAFSILTPAVYYDDAMSAEDATSYFFSNSSLLGALASAIKDMSDSFTRLPKVRGLAQRVWGLEARMRLADQRRREENESTLGEGENENENEAVHVTRGGDSLCLRHIQIAPPRGLDALDKPVPPLISDLSLEVRPGQHTVVRGENGIGKSSMFRVITGLWTATAGTRAGASEDSKPLVQVPDSLFVLPQDSYLPRGTLREQISYPEPGTVCPDAQAEELLSVVGLAPVLDRYGLDTVQDFPNALSGGQKQRLGWARLFFHRPQFALADESTSAISFEQIRPCFEYAKKIGITMVTISHSPEVDAQHLSAIDFVRGGDYDIKNLEESSA
jgi:ABC-type uncharacterized transport system fused permease/ATPase subunit